MSYTALFIPLFAMAGLLFLLMFGLFGQATAMKEENDLTILGDGMIVVNLDVMMAKRKMSLSQLSEKVDITLANLSILKNNKAKAVRFSTLEAICAALDCQPGDILEFVPDPEEGQ